LDVTVIVKKQSLLGDVHVFVTGVSQFISAPATALIPTIANIPTDKM
jgi:hypothetical protein